MYAYHPLLIDKERALYAKVVWENIEYTVPYKSLPRLWLSGLRYGPVRTRVALHCSQTQSQVGVDDPSARPPVSDPKGSFHLSANDSPSPTQVAPPDAVHYVIPATPRLHHEVAATPQTTRGA